MIERIKRVVLWLLVAGFGWCVVVAVSIWNYGGDTHAKHSDCIIVLGAAVQGGAPSPVFEERIQHAIKLHRAGLAFKLLFTGGIGGAGDRSESGVARDFAMLRGVSPGDILIEERSHTTRQNLSEARSVMRHHGLTSAIIVSDPLHMKRAMMMARGLGIASVSSPTPTTRYRSLRTKLGFLIRELYFMHHYVITGE